MTMTRMIPTRTQTQIGTFISSSLESGQSARSLRILTSSESCEAYVSHFIADVANPMHTDQSDKEEGIHSSYESAVDRRIPNYPFRYDGRDPAKPAPRTRRVARVAHRKYWDLVNAYDAHGYNAKVHRITKRQLKRAANALADLITSLR
jgi:hypothetical protein